MDASTVFMWLGFALASYSVIGNDSIQTLGTFLTSNEKKHWLLLWAFAGSILIGTLVYGWYTHAGDVSYGRLEKYPLPQPFGWKYLLPPLVLMLLTRTGIPVSTSFLILTFFNQKNLYDMVNKSLFGYALAFGVGLVVYLLIAKLLERRFIQNPITKTETKIWTVLQWFSTGFLWAQWLIQDLANIYVYQPRVMSVTELIFSVGLLVLILAYIFSKKGGKIQSIVRAKTNTVDLRSATIIDFIYGLILLYFKELNNIPMSTTWVFVGLLAGRELGIQIMLSKGVNRSTWTMLFADLGKVALGLVVSIVLVYIMDLLP